MLGAIAWNLESSLLVVLVLIALRIMIQLRGLRLRMSRIESLLSDRGAGFPERSFAGPDESPDETGSSGSGAFESFLAEDPERREMPKSEQFAAYRKWRKDKGLNWTQS